jgi:hypothetical protein
MNWFFIALCWIVGIVGSDDNHCDRIRARAKCREIKVRQREVVVKFTCEEDAKLFAEDLKNFVRE